MKSKADKQVNRNAKRLNRSLQQDVFKDSFYTRQVKKLHATDYHELHFYLYEFLDNKYPEIKYQKWFSQSEILVLNNLWIIMNDFIVRSDFWQWYWNK